MALDTQLLNRIFRDKMRDPETYWIAVIVGTLINGYGQLLVPWFRGSSNPFAAMAEEFSLRPWLMVFSIFLAYLFPLCVGVISSVITRYKNRRVESVADFPDRKPDPVFRATRDGRFVEVGAATRAFFDSHDIATAQSILGEQAWSKIAMADEPGGGELIFFDAENEYYAVSHAPTGNGQINVYMTRLPGDPAALQVSGAA